MKKTFLIHLTAASLLLLSAACNKETSTTETAAGTDTTVTTSTSTSSTGTVATDSSATTMTAANTGTANATTSSLSTDDKEFMVKAAEGGMSEVQMGQTASAQGSNADVKAFGSRMVSDHSKANDELKQLAAQKGLALPTDVSKDQKEAADKLAKKSGKDFDKGYMEAMVKDHEKDVKEFEKASKDAKDADLKAWATKTLPTLKDHLKMAKEAEAKVK